MGKYFAAAKAGLASAMEYRFDFFTGLLSSVFPVIIQIFLWQAIYSGSDQAMYGYKFPQMMIYVLMAGAVSMFVVTGIEQITNEDIHSGALGIYLCKPINYIVFRIFHTMGKRIPSTAVMAIFTTFVLLASSLFLKTSLSLLVILLSIAALALGVALNFLIFYLISLTGLWFAEVGNFFTTIRVVVMVISGGVFPITVLGDQFAAVAKYLPFTYTTFFPISIITGSLPNMEMLLGFVIQLIWIVVLAVAVRIVWAVGMRKYVSIGG